MNNINKKKSNSTSNLNASDDKNQAFKLIKEYLVTKHQERQKGPSFNEAEISPIDFAKKHPRQSKSPSAVRKSARRTKGSIETPKGDDFRKSLNKSDGFTVIKNSNASKSDYVKSVVSTDSSGYVDMSQNKELNNYYQQMPSILPRANKKFDQISDVKNKPNVYHSYKQCGYKFEDLIHPKYGNYFKVNVGAPRNWLKSKFQHNSKFIDESYMIAN